MIVYGRSNGKALRSALNSVTEVRNGYIYAAATGERIAKIGNTIMMSLQEVLLIMRASFGNKKAKKELRQREIRDRQKQIIRARQRQQLLCENQDKSNNWKRIHGLPATRKNGSKTKQSIAGTRQKGIET
jgi:hypothetical protein